MKVKLTKKQRLYIKNSILKWKFLNIIEKKDNKIYKRILKKL